MITRHKHGELEWIDLESPTQEEVRDLMKEYSLDPLVAEELLSPTLRPKVDHFEGYIYTIFHFPVMVQLDGSESQHEIDFIVGKNFIITTRYNSIDPLNEFSKMFEVESLLDKENMGEHAGFIFYYMMKKLYQSVDNELAYLNDILIDINNRIFNGEEKEMVFHISQVSRDLLNFRRTLSNHKEILVSFEEVAGKLFDKFSYHVSSIMGEYYHVQNRIDVNMDNVIELRETNNSLVSTKQNEIMKILTIMAFVTFPLSLFASIFGMNTTTLPIVGHPFDFWFITGGMLIFTFVFFGFFKYKKWL